MQAPNNYELRIPCSDDEWEGRASSCSKLGHFGRFRILNCFLERGHVRSISIHLVVNVVQVREFQLWVSDSRENPGTILGALGVNAGQKPWHLQVSLTSHDLTRFG